MKRRLIAWLMRQPRVQAWLLFAASPKPSEHEVIWTKDDAHALDGFLATNTGKKLLLELENFKADTETAVMLRTNERTAFPMVSFARGVRHTVARIKRLTAVRQTPDESEREAVSLPPELEHLSET